MKKLAVIAFAFVLSCVTLAGCRGGNTEMPSTPSEQAPSTTQNSGNNQGDSNSRNPGNDMIRGENSHGRIEAQHNH